MEKHMWSVAPESTIHEPILTWFKELDILDIPYVTWELACDATFTLVEEAPVQLSLMDATGSWVGHINPW